MNKKANTALFILGATLINMIMIFLLFFILIFIASRLFPEPGQSTAQIIFLVIFITSIAGSFFIYNQLIKWLTKKIDMEKYFHPIFRPRKKK